MPFIVVIGSVNLDIVATAPCLPAAGETVTDAVLARYPGGKGGNQALAARRLGADVALVGRVGKDAEADVALALLREGGVDVSGVVAVDNAATGRCADRGRGERREPDRGGPRSKSAPRSRNPAASRGRRIDR